MRVPRSLLAVLLSAGVLAFSPPPDAGPDEEGEAAGRETKDEDSLIEQSRRAALFYNRAWRGIHPSMSLRFDLTMTPPPALALAPRRIELSRFACTMYGADRGGYLGLGVGFLGSISGIWDDRTAMVLMGAGAALGAIWGGTAGADDPAFRVRYEWER